MKKELLYLIGIILGIILIIGLFFGFDQLSGDTTLDLNIHDTYYVFPSINAVIFTIILIATSAYFVRIVFTRFKNKFANYIFILLNALLIIGLIMICMALNDFGAIIQEKMADGTTGKMATSMNKAIANLLYSAYFMIVLAVFIEIVIAFKTKKLHDASAV